MPEKAQRVAVIGAGLGGLALGLRLAARGRRVTLFEQDARPGGKMNRLQRDGFTFDTGPSLVTLPHVFAELFEAAGLRIEDHVELMPVRPFAAYRLADGTAFEHSADLPSWLATVRRLEDGPATGYLRFMDLAARLHEVSRHTFLAASPWERPRPPPLRVLLRVPWRQGFGNYARVVERHLRSDALRRFLFRYPTYVGSSPWRTPSTLAVIPWIEHTFGAWHIRGGLYALVEAIARAGASLGMEVRTGARVTRILQEGGRARGVELADGTRAEADVVVMNGDASTVPRLLDPDAPAGLPESERSLSGFVLLLGLPRRVPGEAHHRVFFSADYRREFDDLFERRIFPDDPTVYVNLPARTDPSMAPPGGETVFVMANAPANDGDAWDAAAVERATARVFARLRAGGFPDAADAVVREAWTPRRIGETYGMPGGAIYGTHSHGYRRAFLRPPNRDRRLRGLYAVGGSTHPGGGTPTVLMSARIVQALIEARE